MALNTLKRRDTFLDRINPIANLTLRDARAIFDAARRCGSPLLQRIYDEIELADPVLMTCVERRASALSALGWSVKKRASADQVLADEQLDALDEFASRIENLSEAIEHLDLAFFRRHSFVQPLWEGPAVRHISLLDSWNFLYDRERGWFWNPEAKSDIAGLEPITPEMRLVSVVRRRAIDFPALIVYIRKSLGERDWGRYIERFGIPSVDVVMPPSATEANKADFLEAAERARDGLPAVWPAGSTPTTRGADSRGQNPFDAFIEYHNKMTVLMATGGTLTSLAQSDTGSLAGGAQMDVWKEIVSRDSAVISEALMRGLFIPYLEQAFPGREIAAEFAIGQDEAITPKDAASLAATLKQAGYLVDQSELEEATGFSLVKDTSPAPGGFSLNSKQPSGGSGDAPRPVASLDEILEQALAEAAASSLSGSAPAAPSAGNVKNVVDANGQDHDHLGRFGKGNGGEATTFTPATTAEVTKFKTELPKAISPEEFDAILTTGFDDTDGAGNKVKYGTLLRDHINEQSRNAEDLGARKRELGNIVRIVRETQPVPTARAGGKERIYAGHIGDKAYVAVADEHNEIGAFVMVSYRRDGKHDKK